MVWSLRFNSRNLDAESGPELARLHLDGIGVSARVRFVSGRTADPAVLIDRRCGGGPNGQEESPSDFAVFTDDFCLDARRSDLLRQSERLAHPVAFLFDRHCAGFWRTGLSVADSY